MRLHSCALAVIASVVMAGSPATSVADDTSALQDAIVQMKKIIADQQKIITDLASRVAALEAAKGRAATKDEDIPPLEIPTGASAERSTQAAAATLMPDLAVIGNHTGTFLVPRGYDARNRFQLGEVEIALQQPIYTGMTFYATLAAGADAGFAMGAEEAYAALSRPFKLPFDADIGKRRIQFGKANALHPHAWHYVDQPAAMAALLGPEGLFGNGASVNYTVPTRGMFANVELGMWGSSSAHAHVHHEEEEDAGPDEHDLGAQISGDMPVGRLWLSKALGGSSEMELGASHAFGRAANGDNIRLTGLDLTYRAFPSTFSRLQLQGEAFWHRRTDVVGGSGSHTRSGHYALLTYSPDQYYEYGVRYDNTKYAWPLDGREQSLSLILSNRLTEATLVRLQCKFGDRTSDILLPARKGYSEVFLQFIWGAGSHKHPLQ